MSKETILSVPFMGADFVLAVDAHNVIKDVKLAGRWWPAVNVLSVQLLQGLQGAINDMPENSED